MLYYFRASDRQAALADLINLQESFHGMYRICTDNITEQRRIRNSVLVFAAQIREEGRFYACTQSDMAVLCDSVSQHHLAAWHAYPIELHTLLRHRMHADFLPKTLVYTRNIKREDTTPLLRLLFRPS